MTTGYNIYVLGFIFIAIGVALSFLYLFFRKSLGEQRLKTALEMLEVNANCPRSSSLGRWFDAVAEHHRRSAHVINDDAERSTIPRVIIRFAGEAFEQRDHF